MGVYIKGIEMPRSERYTVIKIFDSGDWYAEEKNFLDDKNVELYYKFEAATNIKEPHGRLIDVDAFFKDICDSLDQMTDIGIAVDGNWLWAKLNDAMKNAPTVIERSER